MIPLCATVPLAFSLVDRHKRATVRQRRKSRDAVRSEKCHKRGHPSRASSLLKADLFPTRADQIKALRVLRDIGVTLGKPLCFRRAMRSIEVIGQSDHWGV
jgi:hypothetical protein